MPLEILGKIMNSFPCLAALILPIGTSDARSRVRDILVICCQQNTPLTTVG